MTALADHLAELTGFRDRELLDITLASALRDLLHPRSVTIFRSVGEAGNERWLTRARLGADDIVATADPSWIELDALPRRDADGARLEAFERQTTVSAAGACQRTLMPISTDLETVGVLEVETDDALSDQDQRMVSSILRIYRNFQALLDYSEHDTLTGLRNRKTFDENFMKASALQPGAIQAAGRRAPTASAGHWLGMIDVDHFKRVNDRHGHLIGDEVLLLMSRLMRNCFRLQDQLYRFGGEEFLVLIRCAGPDEAAIACERLRSTVERYVFPQVGSITVSIGLTELRAGDTPSVAIERADKAVYMAKDSGRNQLCRHDQLGLPEVTQAAPQIGDIELF